MSTTTWIILATIVLYLLLMLAIGWYFSKKNASSDDFYLGGRKLGPLVTAMSAEASDMSSWLLMGLPGVAYLSGICNAAWTAIGLAIGTYLNWLIVAKRIRLYSQKINAITIPDFFSKRYHDRKNILTAISAIVIIVFFIPYTASGFAACGKLFNSLFGLDYMAAMIICAIIIVGYTALGGFLAASTTDLVQSIIMTVALIVILVYGTVKAGGVNAVLDNAKSLEGYLSLGATYNAATNQAESYGVLKIASMLAWGLGYFGMPHILLRFMAIKDENKLKLSRRIASVWVVISMTVAIIIGVVALGMVANNAMDPLEDSERAIISIATLIANKGYVFAAVAGLIMAGIMAATMSTADSQLLAAASSVSQNLISDFFGKKLSEKKSLLVARITVIVISIISVILASNPQSNVFNIVSFAWAGFGAAFGGTMLLALFWKRSNMFGALAGMIAGGVMVFVWKYLISPMGGLWGIYELLPAFIVSVLADVIVSLVTPAPEQSVIDEFENV